MFRTFAQKFLRQSNYRADIQRLRGMSDRELADLGLTRGGIDRAVRTGMVG